MRSYNKHKVPILDENSKSGWTKRFERELKKLNPLLLVDLPSSVAAIFFESARYTPLSAAMAYRDLKEKKAYEHGQSSRPSKS